MTKTKIFWALVCVLVFIFLFRLYHAPERENKELTGIDRKICVPVLKKNTAGGKK